MSPRVSDTSRKMSANHIPKGGYGEPNYKIGGIILDLGPTPHLGRGLERKNSRVYPTIGLDSERTQRHSGGGARLTARPIKRLAGHKSASEARMNQTGHALSSIVRPPILYGFGECGLCHSPAGAGVGAATPNFRLRLASYTSGGQTVASLWMTWQSRQ